MKEEEINGNGSGRQPGITRPAGINLGNGLVVVDALTAIFILLAVFLPESVIRSVLAIPLMLIFPGYPLVVAVFPGKKGINGLQRFALSCVCSVMLVIFTGLLLDQTSWGIRLEPVMYSLASFVFLMSLIAWGRLLVLEKQNRYRIVFSTAFLLPSAIPKRKWLNLALIIIVLAASGLLGFVTIQPHGETFTSFYMLGEHNLLSGYPSSLMAGEEGRVTLGIINREGEEVDYFIESVVAGVSSGFTGPVVVNDNETWESEITFRTINTGPRQKVEFLLYRDLQGDPYRSLHFWIDVEGE